RFWIGLNWMFRAAVSKAVQLLSTTSGPQPLRNIEPKFTKLFINNEWLDSSTRSTIGLFNPANEKLITEVEEADFKDVDIAVQAANAALTPNSPWRRMDGEQRAHLLLKVANLIERDKNILASLESLDNGKPFMTAYEVDLPLSIECIRHYANYARMMGDAPTAPRVCGEIIPWISPLLSLTWKFAPALATGNAVVMKLPERTPLSGLHVAGLIREADFPDGVFNVVVGVRAKAGRALVTHKGVDGMASIKFLRKAIEEASQSSIKKVPIEVNARSSCIVFADSNLKLAVKQAHYGIFFSNGRGYSVGSRAFVESKVYDEFVDRSKDLAERLIVGDPFEPSTQQGPQIDGHQVEEILRHVESGKRDGAHLVTGGTKWGDRGHYVLPTVLANVDDHMAIAKEEIIGPVMKLIRFDSMEDLLVKYSVAQNSQPVVVITKDADRARFIAQHTLSGSLWVNSNYQTEVGTVLDAHSFPGQRGLQRTNDEWAANTNNLRVLIH
uniref:Aldedh domain-containing protein n=1 Tax=Haemonchus contortus TaxID=6289 RepID=A0A7I4XZZ6_HAECO